VVTNHRPVPGPPTGERRYEAYLYNIILIDYNRI
jgi:hypothetical protein